MNTYVLKIIMSENQNEIVVLCNFRKKGVFLVLLSKEYIFSFKYIFPLENELKGADLYQLTMRI